MNTFTTFLSMGGHGLYVWSAYGITFFVLAVTGARLLQERRNLRRQLLRHNQQAQTTHPA